MMISIKKKIIAIAAASMLSASMGISVSAFDAYMNDSGSSNSYSSGSSDSSGSPSLSGSSSGFNAHMDDSGADGSYSSGSSSSSGSSGSSYTSSGSSFDPYMNSNDSSSSGSSEAVSSSDTHADTTVQTVSASSDTTDVSVTAMSNTDGDYAPEDGATQSTAPVAITEPATPVISSINKNSNAPSNTTKVNNVKTGSILPVITSAIMTLSAASGIIAYKKLKQE